MIRPLPVGMLTIAGDDPDLAMTAAVAGISLQRRISVARSAPDAFGAGGEVFGAIRWNELRGRAAHWLLRQQHQRPAPHADESLEQRGFLGGQRIGAADDHGRNGVEDGRIEAPVRRAGGQRRRDSAPISDREPRIVFERSPDECAVPRRTRIEHQDR